MIFGLFDVVTVKPLTRDAALRIVAVFLRLFKSEAAANDAAVLVEMWSVKPNNGISLHNKKSPGLFRGLSASSFEALGRWMIFSSRDSVMQIITMARQAPVCGSNWGGSLQRKREASQLPSCYVVPHK